MYFAGIILTCCVAAWLLIGTVLGYFEKRLVWPYGEPEAQPQFPDVSGYGERWVTDALAAGFTFLGWSPDIKGSLYKTCYGLLLSPERETLAMVGIGSILGIPLEGTWLYSAAANGRVVYSTDNESCVEIDLSGLWKSQLIRAHSLQALFQRHKELLLTNGFVPRPFSADHALDEFKAIREERFQAMARAGLISFLDDSCTRWRYTLFGALKLSALSHSIALLRAITFKRFPKSA
jgi:hypothetical protein